MSEMKHISEVLNIVFTSIEANWVIGDDLTKINDLRLEVYGDISKNLEWSTVRSRMVD